MWRTKILILVTFFERAAPIVVVKGANGSLYICADFTGVKAVLCGDCYFLAFHENIFTNLSSGTCFLKLDLAEPRFQTEVDPEFC